VLDRVLADQINNVHQIEVACYNAAMNQDVTGLGLCLVPEFTYNAPDGSTRIKSNICHQSCKISSKV
jgi:hypothetical protein